VTARRILVVEDSPTQAAALCSQLEAHGMSVVQAPSGDAALEALADGPYDVVVSDVMMPGRVDGYDLCRRIKAGEHRGTAVVLLTALADPMDIIRGLEAGADNFFTKPYDPVGLIDRVEMLLAARQARHRDRRMSVGVKVVFMGRQFTITSEREQILDLLVSTFEDAVRRNQELQQRKAELEEAREALAAYAGGLEQDLERFFNISVEMLAIAGNDGFFRRLNPAWTRTLGWSREDLLRQPYLDFVHPEDRAATIAEASALQAGRETIVFENRYRCRDGSYRWLLWNAAPVPGQPFLIAAARDITDRKASEQALLQKSAFLEALQAVTAAAAGATRLREVLQVAVSEVGRRLHWAVGFACLPPEGGPADVLAVSDTWWLADPRWAELQQRLGGGPVAAGSLARRAAARGRPVWAADLGAVDGGMTAGAGGPRSGLACPVRVGDATVAVLVFLSAERRARDPAVVGVVEQVAAQVGRVAEREAAARGRDLAERQLRQAQKMEAIGRLAGGVAHDFNNLLTVILGEAEATRDLDLPAPARAALEEIGRAAGRAAGLTAQLLAFSRQQPTQPTTFGLNGLVQGMEQMLRRLIGETYDCRLDLAAAPDRVLADRGQVEQVLMNLVVNARDAMPGGGRLSLETRTVSLDRHFNQERGLPRPGPYVLLAVSDTGAGMSEEVKAHLFEPFFTTKPAGQGTGLGLATSYGIVQRAGGYIGVYSEVGHGTTMKVYLPLAEQAASAPAPHAGTPAAGGTETILVVEDDGGVRNLVSRMLRSKGYHVVAVGDGEAALERLAEPGLPVALLVTDVMLPGMSGRALAARARERQPALRVLFASGYAPGHLGEELPDGARMLHKPFTADQLLRAVRAALDAEEAAP
jgi:two-component system, cell cycle sensor histidine kinase and response regulator CckA